jgi:hypothetical protein
MQVEKRGLEVSSENLWELLEAIENDDRREVLLTQVAERGLEVFGTTLSELVDAVKTDDWRIAATAEREKRERKTQRHEAHLKSIEKYRDESYHKLFLAGRASWIFLPRFEIWSTNTFSKWSPG